MRAVLLETERLAAIWAVEFPFARHLSTSMSRRLSADRGSRPAVLPRGRPLLRGCLPAGRVGGRARRSGDGRGDGCLTGHEVLRGLAALNAGLGAPQRNKRCETRSGATNLGREQRRRFTDPVEPLTFSRNPEGAGDAPSHSNEHAHRIRRAGPLAGAGPRGPDGRGGSGHRRPRRARALDPWGARCQAPRAVGTAVRLPRLRPPPGKPADGSGPWAPSASCCGRNRTCAAHWIS